jgi:hypothetical protein
MTLDTLSSNEPGVGNEDEGAPLIALLAMSGIHRSA